MTDLRIVSEPRGDVEDATFVRDGLALFNVAVTGDSYVTARSPSSSRTSGARFSAEPLVMSGEGGSTSTPCGWLSRFADKGTERGFSGPPRTKPGCRDAMVSS